MKRAATDHPKLANLADAIAAEHKHQRRFAILIATGILERLWHFTAKFTPQGDIGKRRDEEICRWVGWPIDDSSTLIRLLIQTEWLVNHPVHRLIIHDWQEHADDTTKRALQRKNLDFVCPDMSGQESSAGASARGQKPVPEAGGGNPSSSPTAPPKQSSPPDAGAEREQVVTEGWEAFQSAYPSQTGVDAACRWWISECSRPYQLAGVREYVAGVMDGLKRYLASAKWRDRETGEIQPQFVPAMDVFLGARPQNSRSHIAAPMWKDSPPPWQPPRQAIPQQSKTLRAAEIYLAQRAAEEANNAD